VSYEQDLQDRAYEVAQQQHENACMQGWLQVLRLYPKLSDHEANYKAVKDYIHPFPITVGAFRLMLDNPRAVATLDMKDNRERVFSDLVDEICDLLRSPTSGGRGGRHSDAALANERKRLQTFSKEQLVARRNEIVEKQRLAGMSVSKIREELKANRQTPSSPAVLPQEYSRERIHAMKSTEIRALIRQFGASTVNDRLFSRS
jgi:hypothetical protein